ncbi:response regulator [Rathayibacter sp. YIM 133350]|uniref:response regulator n=1 Tax=Rathayibacter sp. YIM 133350 TaxID=3131992 RepID=UPI00307E395A
MTVAPLRALIADDDADLRVLLEIAARRAGFEVAASVSNGRQALDAILTGEIEVALLDVSMPELTGLEVMKQARAAGQHPRVVIVSASVDAAALDAGIAAGADEYIVKPFSPRQLGQRLAELADGWARQDAP